MKPEWLRWIRRVQAIARNGLTYCESPFDRERYTELEAVAAQMLAALAGSPPERVLGLLRAQDGYVTPKVDVRGVVFQDDRLLLVRERGDGGWTLPGGWADVGCAPSEAVVAEVEQESGYRTRAVKLLAAYDRDRHGHTPLAWSVYRLFFLCELTGGVPRGSSETDAVGFFDESALPPLSASRVTEPLLRRMFAHRRNPCWPTDFD